MPIGIRPTNDFAFKKVFGAPASEPALTSLLNAILAPAAPIVEVTIENPFSVRDFQDDKLSVLDVKATDSTGAWYNVEMQVNLITALTRRLLFYNCHLFVGQLRAGQGYAALRPAVTICLLDSVLYADTPRVRHEFGVLERRDGREFDDGFAIHTLELPKFRLTEAELPGATPAERWLYWLLRAHAYEAETLLRLFPDPAMRQATQALERIAQVTEDKTMYDAREKARLDRQSELEDSFTKGEVKVRVETIRMLQELLDLPLTEEQQLKLLDLEKLQNMTADLQKRLRERQGS